MMEWSIDQYNQPVFEDDEGQQVSIDMLEVTRQAALYEGIIVTIDGQQHNIPLGGGIVRTPSALNFGPWIDSCAPPEGWMNYLIRHLVLPSITDNVYQSNIILYRLMKEHRKPPVDPEMPVGLMYARHVSDVHPE